MPLRSALYALAASAALFATPAYAHGDIVADGVIADIKPDKLNIRTSDGYIFELEVSILTRVKNGTTPITLGDLKVGQQIHIDGYGDYLDGMEALAITVTAKPAPEKPK